MRHSLLLYHHLPSSTQYWPAISAVLRRYLSAFYPSLYTFYREERSRTFSAAKDERKEERRRRTPGAEKELTTGPTYSEASRGDLREKERERQKETDVEKEDDKAEAKDRGPKEKKKEEEEDEEEIRRKLKEFIFAEKDERENDRGGDRKRRKMTCEDFAQFLVDLQTEIRLFSSSSSSSISSFSSSSGPSSFQQAKKSVPPSLPYFHSQSYQSKILTLFTRLPSSVCEDFFAFALPRMMFLCLESPLIFPSSSSSSDLSQSLSSEEKEKEKEEERNVRSHGEAEDEETQQETLKISFSSSLPPLGVSRLQDGSSFPLSKNRDLPLLTFLDAGQLESLHGAEGKDDEKEEEKINKRTGSSFSSSSSPLSCFDREVEMYFLSMSAALTGYHLKCSLHNLPFLLFSPPPLLLSCRETSAMGRALMRLMTSEVEEFSHLYSSSSSQESSQEEEKKRRGNCLKEKTKDEKRNDNEERKEDHDEEERKKNKEKEKEKDMLFLPSPSFFSAFLVQSVHTPWMLQMPACAVLRSLRLSRSCSSLSSPSSSSSFSSRDSSPSTVLSSQREGAESRAVPSTLHTEITHEKSPSPSPLLSVNTTARDERKEETKSKEERNEGEMTASGPKNEEKLQDDETLQKKRRLSPPPCSSSSSRYSSASPENSTTVRSGVSLDSHSVGEGEEEERREGREEARVGDKRERRREKLRSLFSLSCTPFSSRHSYAVTADSLAHREDLLLPLEELKEKAEKDEGIDASRHLEILADFANQWIGGGALARGCVQEEIFFATHPELLLLRFFQQRLSVNETCAMSGAMRFSRYSGYGESFTCLLNSSSSSSSSSPTSPRSSSDTKHRSLTLMEDEDTMKEKMKQKGNDVSEAVRFSSLSSLSSACLGSFLRSRLGDLQGVENVDCRPLFISFLPSSSSLNSTPTTQDRREEEREDVQEKERRERRRDEEEGEEEEENKRVVKSVEVCTLITGLDAQRYAGVGSAGGGHALLPFHQYEVFQMLREINKGISALTFSPGEDSKYEVYIHQNYCQRFDQLHQKYLNLKPHSRSSSSSPSQWLSSSHGDSVALSRSTHEKRQQEKEKEEERDKEEEETQLSVDSEKKRRLKRPFVTGNWGCGVFKGDPQLKFFLQWIGASLLKRSLVYHAHGRPELIGNPRTERKEKDKEEEVVVDGKGEGRGSRRKEWLLKPLVEELVKNKCTVAQLWRSLVKGSVTSSSPGDVCALSKEGPFNYIGNLLATASSSSSLSPASSTSRVNHEGRKGERREE
ncbi:poly(adp-ribose) glycohydrolase [Cystoisospora suis]|uniref:Poly(Adp-ribose) glycohydrolase n=1 Tax=Cystoisospora suis TaxID=483139 RepID=A0A2C6KJG2_9APIC|nr:poly(adp-ribose) glycohydrolase [Cystoisospora suis]